MAQTAQPNPQDTSPGSTEEIEHVLQPIPSRWRSKPWFESDAVTSVPRRNDLFLDPLYVQAQCSTALAGGKTIRLSWATVEFDEELDRDTIADRSFEHVRVMDIVDYYPLGWAYVQVPGQAHALIIPFDVVTDIGIEL